MSSLVLGFTLVCSFTIILDVLLIYRWSFYRKTHERELSELPKVSILIAARNEENNLTDCLESLLQLDYPTDKLEVFIGDDKSEDRTYEIADKYSQEHAHIEVFKIDHNLGSAKGKANVLAYLAKKSQTEYLLITDADITVPHNWVKTMLEGVASTKVGIVNGVTAVKDNVWQNMDWLFALGMVKVIHDLGHPVTAMGNNMLVTKEAYQAVGGYESIPFSVTEDFELFKHVRKEGYDVTQLFNRGVLAQTKGQKSFVKLMHQRKRWMMGAVQLPFIIVFLLLLQAIYFPSLLVLTFLNPEQGMLVAGIKIIIQATFILVLANHLRLRVPFFRALIYELYSLAISLSSGLYYLLPVKIIWKGRKY